LGKNNGLYVIVPHRGVTVGKSRLGAVLDDAARDALNRWLLLQTLRVLNTWLGDAKQCMVVSPCAVTLALAQQAGAVALNECTPGLNPALLTAADHAARLGARRLLILPCDLPRLDIAALRAMTEMAGNGAEAVIAPDRHGTGTNALLVPAVVRRFAFGEGSLARHIAMTKECGLRTKICRRAALAFDLDTAQDLAEWQPSGTGIPPLIAGCRVAA
jgi:2-phospho-L-lactate guanylyltransferase